LQEDFHERATKSWQATFITAFVISLSAAQWVQTANSPKGSGITDLVVKQSNGYLFATTGSFNWPNADTGGVHRSTDGGDTWTRVFPAYIARTIALKQDSILFASVWPTPTQTEGLYYSTNNGTTWNLTWDGGPSNNVFAVAFDPSNPLRAYNGSRYGIARNLSGGTTGAWSIISNLPLGSWVRDIAIDQNGWVFVAVQHQSNPNLNGVYYSTNQGQSFVRTGLSAVGDTVSSLIVVRDSLVGTVASSGGSYLEAIVAGTTNGKVRKAVILGILTVQLLYSGPANAEMSTFAHLRRVAWDLIYIAAYDKGSLAANTGGGILESTDRGASWRFINEGLPTSGKMSAIEADSAASKLYAGMFLDQNNGGPIYRRTIITAVRSTSSDVPRVFSLHQNFPNPFNPTTTIRFDLPAAGFVSLRVFDILGREVRTLVSEVQDAGFKSARLDANGLASGVYFYKLNAGSFSASKKLLIVR